MTGWIIFLTLTIFILMMPITIIADYTESLKLDIKIFIIKFQILPSKKGKGLKKEKKKKAKKSEDIQKKKNFSAKGLLKEQGVSGILSIIKKITGVIYKTSKLILKIIVIKKIFVDITVGGNDPAKTAVNYGHVNSVVMTFAGMLCSNLRVRKYDINIQPDFLASKSEGSIFAEIRLRVIGILIIVIYFGYCLLKSQLLSYLKENKEQVVQQNEG